MIVVIQLVNCCSSLLCLLNKNTNLSVVFFLAPFFFPGANWDAVAQYVDLSGPIEGFDCPSDIKAKAAPAQVAQGQ